MRFVFCSVLCLLSSIVLMAQGYVPGEALIKFQAGINPQEIVSNMDVNKVPVSLGRCVSHSWNIWVVNTDKGREDEAISAMYHQPGVLVAQLNHYLQHRSITPNDTFFPQQWALQNTGQFGGTPGIDINVTNAWEIATGGNSALGDTIVIAVIDGGADLTHHDLNFHKNYLETPGNGIDDDHNGYIDDYHGWNAHTHNDSLSADGHGTHVCGIAGAIGHNTIGVSGVCWNVQLMPLGLFTYEEAEVVEAYTYVYDQRRDYNQTNGAKGAFVVATNSSFGTDFGKAADYPLWCAMYDSLGKVGILNAAATANFNVDVDVSGDMPTTCPSDYLITATNMQRDGSRYPQCGYGAVSIDIAAPGTAILSTYPNNGYGNLSGSSMSSPQVAGAIALMYAAGCVDFMLAYREHPDSIAKLVKKYIIESADTTADFVGITVSGGRLNVYKSMLRLLHDFCDTCIRINYAVTNSTETAGASNISTLVIGGVPPFIYQWSGESNDTTANLVHVTPGVYYLSVTDAAHCSKSIRVVVGYSGIDDVDADVVKCYPNPSNGDVNLELPEIFNHATVSIIDALGRKVWTSVMDGGNKTIPMQALPQGIYLLTIEKANSKAVRKIVRY